MKEHSEEQKERAETAEFQISTISQEYRKLVESRDAEIRHLKTDNEKLRQDARRLMYGSASDPHSPLKELAQLQLSGSSLTAVSHSDVAAVGVDDYDSVDIGSGGEWMDNYHGDFSDVISSQAEINQLRLELSKLGMEVQHWKSMAEDKVIKV